MAGPPTPPGWVASLHKLLGSFLALVQNRLDLICVEASEETLRFIEALLLGIAFLFLSLLGLLVLTLAVLLWVSAEWRPLVAIVFALLYLGGAGLAFAALSKLVKNWSPFAGTMEEFRKDLECLRPKN